jgi:hypothetical protein
MHEDRPGACTNPLSGFSSARGAERVRLCADTRSDGDADQYAYIHAHIYSHGHTNEHAHIHTYGDGDADQYAYIHAHIYSHEHTNEHAHIHAYGDGDAHADPGSRRVLLPGHQRISSRSAGIHAGTSLRRRCPLREHRALRVVIAPPSRVGDW